MGNYGFDLSGKGKPGRASVPPPILETNKQDLQYIQPKSSNAPFRPSSSCHFDGKLGVLERTAALGHVYSIPPKTVHK